MAQTKNIAKGTVIFKEGQWETCFYCIKSGKVGIYAGFGEKNETLLTELGEGKFFGEMATVDFMMRSATAVALEDTEVEIIFSEELDDFLNNNPDKIIAILRNLTGRLRELSEDYTDACRTAAAYVQCEKDQNAGLLKKIRKFIAFVEKYDEAISAIINDHPEMITPETYGWY